ncbi:MAG: hypothetical protein J6Y75_05640 [Spirochaetaceae bacterium]|nr:hypothetical protein [Spirochaetaceae bacterium]
MKKLLSFLFITVFVLVLTACGGGGGGGGGVSSSPSSGSPAGSTVSYAPAYTYNVPADKTSSTAYLIRSNSSYMRSLSAPGATSFSSIAINETDFVTEGSFAPKRFAQNTEEWPVPGLISVSKNSPLYSIQPKSYNIDDTEKFWVITNFTTSADEEKTFALKKIGTHCRVWYDVTNPNGLIDSQLETIKDKLDAMFEVETTLCGSMVPTKNYSDVITITDTTKLEIVVYQMESGLCGYFSPKDFTPAAAHSNKAPIIYITSADTSPNMYSTVSHEFDHLLNFVNKTLNHGLVQETWYTELLSNTIEEVLENFNQVTGSVSVRSRLPYFLQYYNYGLYWNQDGPSYANVYAFGAWLLRNYGTTLSNGQYSGAMLFREIATNAYVNEESIVRAVNALNGTNETFASLRQKFMESLIYTEAGCGKANFNKAVYDTGFFDGVTIVMPSINLNSIVVIPGSNVSADIASKLINCTAGSDYCGPCILKPTAHYANILPYGFEIQKLGNNLTQIEIPSGLYGDFTVDFK